MGACWEIASEDCEDCRLGGRMTGGPIAVSPDDEPGAECVMGIPPPLGARVGLGV
jgi:hypothetical protein